MHYRHSILYIWQWIFLTRSILSCHSFVCGFTGVLMWYFLMVLWMRFMIPLTHGGNYDHSHIVCAGGFFVIFLPSFISFWLVVFPFLWTIWGIVSFFLWVSSSSLLSSSVRIFARCYRLPTAKSHLDSQLWVLGGCISLFCFCLVVVSAGPSVSFSSSLLCLFSVSYMYLCLVAFFAFSYCSVSITTAVHAWSASRIVINLSFACVCMAFVSSFVILLGDIT